MAQVDYVAISSIFIENSFLTEITEVIILIIQVIYEIYTYMYISRSITLSHPMEFIQLLSGNIHLTDDINIKLRTHQYTCDLMRVEKSVSNGTPFALV